MGSLVRVAKKVVVKFGKVLVVSGYIAVVGQDHTLLVINTIFPLNKPCNITAMPVTILVLKD